MKKIKVLFTDDAELELDGHLNINDSCFQISCIGETYHIPINKVWIVTERE